MRSFSLHFGRHSADAEQRPLRTVEVVHHAEGWSAWVGPVGLVVYVR